jgi:hypothetical protein
MTQTLDEFIAQGIEVRSERISAVERYTEEHPDLDERALERLADYILREELTDPHPDKITRTEYPFMSTWQLDLRRDKEYGEGLAENHGADGRNYNEPKRRRRTSRENMLVDKYAKARNKERRAKYREFVETQPIVSYRMSEAEIGERYGE